MSYIKTQKAAKDVKEGDFVRGIGRVESISNQSHMIIIRCGKKRTVFDENDEVTIIQRGEY